nr:hypothetical protein [Tanacetum cinerariifolium]
MRERGCATWDGGNITWGDLGVAFGTVPVCVRAQKKLGKRGFVFGGRSSLDYCL